MPASLTRPNWWGYLNPAAQRLLAGTGAQAPLEVESPQWWLYRLLARMEAERPSLQRLERYYVGDHDLPDTIDNRTKQRYQTLLKESKANYCRLVVDACAERLRLQGVRLGEGDTAPDMDTWNLIRRNQFDSWMEVAFVEMLAKRRSYLSVSVPKPGMDDFPQISVEDALSTYVEHVPGNPRHRAAGIKVWIDDWTGLAHAEVYLPARIDRWQADSYGNWLPNAAWGLEGTVVNRLGKVPLYPLINRPTLFSSGVGFGEFEDLMPTQDRLNETILNRLLAGHLAAFRQKWATGIEIPEDERGNPIAPFESAVTSLWVSEDSQARFGEFGATDLKNYTTAEDQDIQHIAVLSRTPRHYFSVAGQAPSGDALKSAEAGLVAKVFDKQRWVDAPLSEAIMDMRSLAGLPEFPYAELVWQDPEFRTFGQLVDGALKLVQSGIASKAWARETIGMSPTTQRRVEAELVQDQLLDDVFFAEPPPEPVTGDTDG